MRTRGTFLPRGLPWGLRRGRVWARAAFRRLALAGGGLAAAALLGACGAGAEAPDAPAEPAEPPRRLAIVATTTFLGDLARNVVGDYASVTVLMPVGTDPHAFQASARQAADLRAADLVLANGLGLEAGLVDVLASAARDGANVLYVAEHLDPQPLDEDAEHSHAHGGSADHGREDQANGARGEADHADDDHADGEHADGEHADGEHADDEHADDDHADGEHADDEHADGDHADGEHADGEHADGEHADDEHADGEHADGEHADDEHADGEHADGEHADDEHAGAGAFDPHVWLDPLRMADAARLVGQRLAALAPDADWPARAEAYAARLLDAHQRIQALFDPIPPEARRLVTTHHSLGYFAARYDMQIVGAVIPSGAENAAPSAAHLAALAAAVDASGVRVIATETTQPTALAQALAREAGAPVAVIELYTGSLGEPASGADSLIGMLTTNAERIAAALRTPPSPARDEG